MNPLLAALVQAGVISQADAERINRSLDPDAARAWAEQQLVIAAQNGLSAQQERLLVLVRRNNGQLSAATLNAFWDAEDARLWAELRPTWEAVTAENAVAMAVRLGADDAMWNKAGAMVSEWLDARRLVAELNAEAQELVGDAPAEDSIAAAFGADRAITFAKRSVSIIMQVAGEMAASIALPADVEDADIAVGELEISEADIQQAMALWDELMPEYRGILDADVAGGS